MCHGVKYTQKIGEEVICHLTECKIVVYVLTLVDNIRLQVVGELIIKKILSLFQLQLLFVLATAREAIQYSAKLPYAHPQKSFSGKDIALKTTCTFLKTLVDNIELFLSLFLRVNFFTVTIIITCHI